MKKVFFFILALIPLLYLSRFLISKFNLDYGDIAVEFHGLIFDVILFGIILTFYENFASRSQEISRFKEELDDYRAWNSKEASQRIYGTIKRLNNRKFYNVDLSNCYLIDQQVQGVKIKRPFSLHYRHSENLKIKNCSISHSYFNNHTFTNGDFNITSFSENNFKKCHFFDCNWNVLNWSSSKFIRTDFSRGKIDSEIGKFSYSSFSQCFFSNIEFTTELSLSIFENCTFNKCKGLSWLNEKGNYGPPLHYYKLKNPEKHEK